MFYKGEFTFIDLCEKSIHSSFTYTYTFKALRIKHSYSKIYYIILCTQGLLENELKTINYWFIIALTFITTLNNIRIVYQVNKICECISKHTLQFLFALSMCEVGC